MDDEESLAERRKRARRHTPRGERRPPTPLDAAGLNELALAYAARFATTRVKLRRYLARKLKERGWAGEGPADPDTLAERLVALGYVDDAAFAAMKDRAMTARGLGRRRVTQALAAAGVAPEDRGEAPAAEAALAVAVAFARRKRLGPFARLPADDLAARQKAMAAMLRAGHGVAAARAVLAARTPEEAEALVAEDGG